MHPIGFFIPLIFQIKNTTSLFGGMNPLVCIIRGNANMIEKEVQNILQNKHTNEPIHKKKLLEVAFLAQELLEKHQLPECEICFLMHSNARGICYNSGEKISLQIQFSINEDMEEIRITILHEIAHALVGNENGHNLVWKKKALELGVRF
jgi:hypothetical protein